MSLDYSYCFLDFEGNWKAFVFAAHRGVFYGEPVHVIPRMEITLVFFLTLVVRKNTSQGPCCLNDCQWVLIAHQGQKHRQHQQALFCTRHNLKNKKKGSSVDWDLQDHLYTMFFFFLKVLCIFF